MTIQNISIIPYARAREIEFFGSNLRPDREAKFYLDDTSVENFIQKSSLIANTGATNLTTFIDGEGLLSPSSNSYATVIKSVPRKGVYINDNYIALKIVQFGVESLSTNSFSKDDFIFQTTGNVRDLQLSTFTGRVEHWDFVNTNEGTLYVSPLTGTISNSSPVIFTSSSQSLANVLTTIVGSKFETGEEVRSTSNATKRFIVDTYEHNHGVITNTNSETNKINLSANVATTVEGKLLRISAGTGLNQVRQIVGVANGSILTLNSALTEFSITGNTKYSIGEPVVDEFGNIAGIFNLPETEQFKFRSGERVFTITDTTNVFDRDATMRASTRYSASGLETESIEPSAPFVPITVDPEPIEPATPVVEPIQQPVEVPQTQPTVETPPDNPFIPVIDTNFFLNFNFGFAFGDPVAQTFYTPKPVSGNTGRGIFVSSVDLFFKKKPLPGNSVDDTEIPAIVRIVETLNGYPTTKVIAETSVPCSEIRVSDGITKFPRVTDVTTITKFKFRDPVYLAPSSEYALVVYSDSPTYEVWISELGESIIGDPDGRRVSEQPYIGSFFRSQNASTWTPYQNQDLMFVINQAVFSSSPVSLTFGVEKTAKDIPYDNLILNSKQLSFPVTTLTYDFKSTLYGTLAGDAEFSSIDPNITYSFSDFPGTSISDGGRRRIVRSGNTNSFQTKVNLSTNDVLVTPIFNAENFNILVSENVINNGELRNDNITIVSGGDHSDEQNVVVTISASDLYPEERATANVTLTGNLVTSINIIDPSRGYIKSPTITISESGVTTENSAIAVITSEDGKFGGNALARYITRKITLADGFDSGDLRVTLRAIRPQGTNVLVYYKVLSASDPQNFSDLNWQLMFLENNRISTDLITPIDFVYRPTSDITEGGLSYVENGITYPLGGSFKYFALKIVMLAECGCVPPTIRNMRAIALPGG